MHPSKVTLRPKVRRPMAWDSTKSAPSAQQPELSTQCPIPGGYRRAETRHQRIHHPDLLRTVFERLGLSAGLPNGLEDRRPDRLRAHPAESLSPRPHRRGIIGGALAIEIGALADP